MTRILSIDPSSNRISTSTTGIVLLDNTKLINYWVVPYGVDNFSDWWQTIGVTIDYDIAIVEKFIVRQCNSARDNSVFQTVEIINKLVTNIVEQANM